MEASLQLSEAALVDIGVPMGLVIASIHEQRDIYRKALVAEEGFAARRALFLGAALAQAGEIEAASPDGRQAVPGCLSLADRLVAALPRQRVSPPDVA